jgi:CHAD domain-containing protein
MRTAEVLERAAGVLDLEEIERVHDMRVATRRLRAAMEVFEPCFPPKRFRKALKEVKALADALGERRDRDVQLEFISDCVGRVGPADRAAVAAFAERLRSEQERANEELVPLVTGRALSRLRRRLRELVEAAR